MVTYKTKNNKANYLTAKNPKAKKVLKYMHKMCEKSLNYCQEQGLTSLEDFAEVLESISEEDNPKLKIEVTVNSGGIGMKMAEQPELGSTTGRYMMQHLGFDEDEQGKFTRTGVESLLTPEDEEDLDEALDFLDEEEEEDTDEEIDDLFDDDIDDVFDEEDEPKPRSKVTESSKPTSPPTGKTAIDYDTILDAAAGISATVATQGYEVDGMNLGGITAQGAILATIVGKKAAQTIMAAAQATGREKQVNKIAQRIKAAQERTDELTERGEQLTQVFEQSQPTEAQSSSPEKEAGELLADAVTQLDEQIDRTGLSEKRSRKKGFQVDKDASFDEQLQQISTALERIEERLDALEERISALEEALETDNQEHSTHRPDVFPATTKATLYFDGGSRRNPGVAAGAAVIILPNGETETTANFIEEGTNNQAEYTGLIVGLKKAQELGCTDLEIHGDSRLVIDQLTGKKRVRSPHLKPLHQEAQDLLSQFNSAELNWIKRKDNGLADQAVNDCIDQTLQAQQEAKVISTKQSPSESTQKCADILLNIYQFEEQVATTEGESVDDGIMLGDNAILYGTNHPDSTTISIEQLSGEELFAAVRQHEEAEWKILLDNLDEKDKQEIQRLEDLPTEIEAKRSKRQVNKAGLQM